jgi:hypothetical protein
LSATVSGQDDIKGFATLIIALPPVKQAEVPLFSQVYYTADYVVNTQGELDTVTISNGPIATEPTDEVTVALVDSEYLQRKHQTHKYATDISNISNKQCKNINTQC